MSQFTLLMKRPYAQGSTLPALQAMPELCILELTDDNLAYLWPAKHTLTSPEALDPDDPFDRELLLTGEFLTYGGFYYSVSDYLRRNGLSETLFYRFHLGEMRDVSEARQSMADLKALL